MTFLIAVLVIVVIILIVTNIRIIPQSSAAVIERLGAYHSTWQVGLHVKSRKSIFKKGLFKISNLC